MFEKLTIGKIEQLATEKLRYTNVDANKYKIYLCGPMNGLSVEVSRGWRNELIEFLPPYISALDPFFGKHNLRNEMIIKDVKNNQNYVGYTTTDKSILRRDYWYVQQCDLVFANLNVHPGIAGVGSSAEIAWSWAMQKPLLVVMGENNPYDHPMVRDAAWWIVPTFEEGKHLVLDILSP